MKQKGKKLRGVVDYRASNEITERNSTSLPRSDEIFYRLGDSCVFSKLDLNTGFHHIRLKPE